MLQEWLAQREDHTACLLLPRSAASAGLGPVDAFKQHHRVAPAKKPDSEMAMAGLAQSLRQPFGRPWKDFEIARVFRSTLLKGSPCSRAGCNFWNADHRLVPI